MMWLAREVSELPNALFGGFVVYGPFAVATWLSCNIALFWFRPIVAGSLLAIFITMMFWPCDQFPPAVRSVVKRLVRGMLLTMQSYWRYRLVWQDKSRFSKGEHYLFAYEPHTVLPFGMNMAFSQAWEGGVRPVVGDVFLAVSSAVLNAAVSARPVAAVQPVVKNFWYESGMRGVSKPEVRRLLREASVVLCPGGVQECLAMEPGKEVAYLRKRHGFIKLAMQTGAKVVPCFGFGQQGIMHYIRPGPPLVPKRLVSALARAIGFLPMIIYGKFFLPIPARGGPDGLYVVVGDPIDMGPAREPSDKEVQEGLDRFIEAMQRLFEAHRGAAGHGQMELVVV